MKDPHLLRVKKFERDSILRGGQTGTQITRKVNTPN